MEKHGSSRPEAILNMLSLLANCSALHLLLVIFAYEKPFLSGFFLWSLLALGVLLLATLFKGTRFSLVSFGAALLLPAVMCMYALRCGLKVEKAASWLALLLIWAAPGIRSCLYQEKTPQPENRETDFELVVLTLLVAAALVSAERYPASLMGSQVIGVLAGLLGLGILRVSGHREKQLWRGIMLMMLLPVSLVGVILFFVKYLADWGIRGMAAAEHSIFFVFGAIGRWLNALMLWLFSLLPASEGKLSGGAEASMSTMSGAMEEMPDTSGPVMTIILLLLAAALLILVWNALRLAGRNHKKQASHRLIGGRVSLPEHLRAFWRSLCEWIRLQIWYGRHKDTPQGALVFLERKYKRIGKPRLEGESCRMFLGRVAEDYHEWEVSDLLDELADCLDGIYFSRGSYQMDPSKIKSLRKI